MCVQNNQECVHTHVCVFSVDLCSSVCVCLYSVGVMWAAVCFAHAGSSVCLGSNLSFAGVTYMCVCVCVSWFALDHCRSASGFPQF